MTEVIRESYQHQGNSLYRRSTFGFLTGESSIESTTGGNDGHGPRESWWKSYLQGKLPTINDQKNKEINIVDLFSGCGGLSLGVVEAIRSVGLSPRIIAAIDIDAMAMETYKANFKTELPLVRNVNTLIDFQIIGRGGNAEFGYDPEILDQALSSKRGNIDILLAGPPCQGHSNLNNHTRREDPRNLLYLGVISIAIALHSKALVIENVPGVVNDKMGIVMTSKTLLKKAGYDVTEKVLNAYELGCAQRRQRHFLIACLSLPASLIEVSKALYRPPMTVEWAIGDLLDCDKNSIFDMTPKLSQENIERIKYLFDHEIYDLPNKNRPDCHKLGHTYPSVYGRLKWDEPAYTITTGFLSPGRGRFIHPLRPRVLTPHEAARIQGFPDSYKFMTSDPLPNRTALCKWIGEAVPPPMGYAVGACALAGLSSSFRKMYDTTCTA